MSNIQIYNFGSKCIIQDGSLGFFLIKVWLFRSVQQQKNKAGLQPVSRPVEQVHYFGGWVEGAKSLWCQGLAGKQKWRCQMLNSGHKSLQNLTDGQTDKICFLGENSPGSLMAVF